MRGTLVIARCYGDHPKVLRVWEVGGKLAYLSEESQFQKLMAGQDALRPIGFPVADVFIYDPAFADRVAKHTIDWSALRKIEL